MAKKKKTIDETDFIRTARKLCDLALELDQDNREKAQEDLKFLDGEEQWPADIKAAREAEGRPCLVINKLPGFLDQVVGDQRQNRPAIKVLPVDDTADPEIAKIYEGLIRNIENTSQADVAYDHAFEHAAGCGYGAFRVVTEYADDDVFEQDIKIKKIDNAFSVVFDPEAKEVDKSDGRFVFIIEDILRETYKERYPDKTPIEFDVKADEGLKSWCTEDTVRVVEYFKKEPITKTIYLLADGTVTDKIQEGDEVVRERQVKTHKIVWYKIDGYQILEGPKDWSGKYFPIVPVWGKELNINGKRKIRGLVRHAKDPQRMYNYHRSSEVEVTALAPKAPYLLTPKQIDGFESQWQQAYKKNFPYLLFNHDPQEPGAPKRQLPGQIPTGDAHQVATANDELKATTGIYDASLGNRSNETSGRAIRERKVEGDVATFAYIDNLARAIRHCGRILVDLIPKIYDTERIVRLRGEDGKEEFVPINKTYVDPETGEVGVYNDLTVGKYDVVVSVGPSYTTQREEAADSMLGFIKAVPQAAPMIGDLIAKNMNWPGAEEIAERLKPPGVDDENGEGGPQGIPPEQVDQIVAEAVAQHEQEIMDSFKIKQEELKVKREELQLEVKRLELAQKEAELQGYDERIRQAVMAVLQEIGGIQQQV